MTVISICPAQCGYYSPHLFSRRSSRDPTRTLPTISGRDHSQLSSFLRKGKVITRSVPPTVKAKRATAVVCGLGNLWGLGDFLGADLLGFDLDKWYKDVEKYGSIAVYAPAEGGYEGRYACRLKEAGYQFMNLSARSLGDPESYLLKPHGVRPPHLGKQAITCFYEPPEVDFRLARLSPDCKGLVLWVIEAQVLSKSELQFLALLPALRPKVKVIAECGSWRKYRWKPLKEVAGLPLTQTVDELEKPGPTASAVEMEEKKSPARATL